MRESESRTFSFFVTGKGDVVITLESACIQTTAMRARQEIVNALLDNEEISAETEAALDILKRFLEGFDFGRLRTENPQLASGTGIKVRLRGLEDGSVTWNVLQK